MDRVAKWVERLGQGITCKLNIGMGLLLENG